MSKHIGIVACSAEGAALCYRTICSESAPLMGEHFHPQISMHTFPLGDYMKLIYKDDWQGVADLMLHSLKKVQAGGAEFAICPDNTIHQAFPFFIDLSPLPWLHIAEVVTNIATKQQYQKLAILGTKYLMEGPVYRDMLVKKNIQSEIPSPIDREKINTIIFKELVNGQFYESSRLYFNQVIEELKHKGCEAVVLGCTEIPLIVQSADCPLPTLDSTRLLARSAIQYALNLTS
jgi:aspartate racemase